MRLTTLIGILTLFSSCLGQELELIENNTESFYRVIRDSLDPKLNYPDGRYKVFVTDTNKLPAYVFNLRNGKVDSCYLELYTGGWKYGNYSQDSLWTFLTNHEDTTFKVGTWRQSRFDLTIEDVYKMPFDSNDKFTEVWRFHNGQIAREATYKKGFGLEKETYWDFETNEISKQTVNSGTKNYYQSTTIENDSISEVSLIQSGIKVVINFDYIPLLCKNRPCMKVTVYSEDVERNYIPMASMVIDSTKTLTEFKDIKRQFFMDKEKDDNIKIRYQKKSGKMKSKKLKVK